MADDFLGLGGLLDTSENDARLAQTYGITPEAVQQQRMASLGQIGAVLLAAAQPGQRGDRARYLAQLGDVGANASKGYLNAAQARLMGLSLGQKQQEIDIKKQVREMISGLDLTPEQKAWATANPEAFLAARGQAAANLDYLKQKIPLETQAAVERARAVNPLEIERYRQQQQIGAAAPFDAKVQQLTASGVPEDMARGIASGRYVARETTDPATGAKQVGVFDISTGQQVGAPPAQQGGSPLGQLNTAQERLISPMPTQSRDNPGQALDYSSGIGPMAAVRSGLNRAAGVIGKLPYRDTNEAREALNQLRIRTMTNLTADIPGRETNQMRELLQSLAVDPSEVTLSAPMAVSRFQQTKAMIDASIRKQMEQLSIGGLTAAQRSSIRQNTVQLMQLSKDYETVLGSLGGQRQADPAAAGATLAGQGVGQGAGTGAAPSQGAVRRFNPQTGRLE